MKVFVYGTLKQGFGNHRLLQDAIYLGKAVTLNPFRMTGYGVPFVWPDASGKPVQGEVYEIGDPETNEHAALRLRRLDNLESNGRVYERKPHQVRMIENAQGIKPLPRDQGEEHAAWIYEAMEHIQRDYSADGYDQDECNVNGLGALEWDRRRFG